VTSLPKNWWEIVIQRDDSIGGAYPDDVLVRSVSLTYPAVES
jgi:hypothetical protein